MGLTWQPGFVFIAKFVAVIYLANLSLPLYEVRQRSREVDFIAQQTAANAAQVLLSTLLTICFQLNSSLFYIPIVSEMTYIVSNGTLNSTILHS